jgi:uncharacterized protein YjbI with pentapeptide repeats
MSRVLGLGLEGLDPARKGRLLIFLYEAKLIGFEDFEGKRYDAIIFLIDANLSNINLSGVILNGANLSFVDFSGANLSYTEFIDANLQGSNFSNANLYNVLFSGTEVDLADFGGANLTFAQLTGAHLYSAALSGALNLTQEQLDQVFTCKDAILPKGLTCHRN